MVGDKYSKGQVFSVDALIAGLIFISILSITFLLWQNLNVKSTLVNDANAIDFAARNALSVLVQSEGDPYNWTTFADNDIEQSQVFVYGISSSRANILDLTKVQRMKALNDTHYDDYKTFLGLRGYEFQLLIDYWLQDKYVNEFIVGAEPIQDVSAKVVLRRYAILNNTRSRLQLNVWQ